MSHVNSIKVGDRVRVIRKAYDQEKDWSAYWLSSMDAAVGKEFTVHKDCGTDGFLLKNGSISTNCSFPHFVLKKIAKNIVIATANEPILDIKCENCKDFSLFQGFCRTGHSKAHTECFTAYNTPVPVKLEEGFICEPPDDDDIPF